MEREREGGRQREGGRREKERGERVFVLFSLFWPQMIMNDVKYLPKCGHL